MSLPLASGVNIRRQQEHDNFIKAGALIVRAV